MKQTKQYVLLALFILSCSFLNGQCPNSLTFNSQQEIDDFQTDYPDCVNQGWIGNIMINGADISDLSGLIAIHSIRGNLRIEEGQFTSFSSWNSLDTIIDFYISNNTTLSLDGLESVDTIDHFTNYNSELLDISALNNVNFRMLEINAGQMSNISGFNNPTSARFVIIKNLPNLTSITGFQNLETLSNSFTLDNVPNLNDASGLNNLKQTLVFWIEKTDLQNIEDFANLKVVTNAVRIYDNLSMSDINLLNEFYFINEIYVTGNPLINDCCIIPQLKDNGILTGGYSLGNNGSDCSSLFEVLEYCQDSDYDGIEDTNDNCPNNPNPTQSDNDSDGIGDGCDNCPLDANADQADSDGNGIGDVCDNGQNIIGVYNEVGDIYNSSTTNGVILKAIDGSCFRIIVNTDGGIETYPVVCP